VLITPGIAARVDVSFLAKLGIFLGTLFHPKASFHTPIEPEMFTTTPGTLERIRADPLRLRCATARFFWESRRLDRYLARHVEDNRSPILLFLAGDDRIIDNAGVVRLLERGAREPLDIVTYEDQTHSIQFDATERLVADTAAWLERWMAERPQGRATEPGHPRRH
jgi:alpha-beta hydrolase superfamily lysophospholipase